MATSSWSTLSLHEEKGDLPTQSAVHLQVSASTMAMAERRHSAPTDIFSAQLATTTPTRTPGPATTATVTRGPTPVTPRKQRWKTGVSLWPLQVETSDLPSDGKRKPFGAVVTQPQEAPKVARATPFLPGISGGIWSPPGWPTTLTPPEKEKEKKKEKEIEDKDAEIRLLHDRIERLMCEKEMALSDNARLAGQINRLSVISPLPPVAPIPVRPFSGFPYPYSVPPLTPVDNVYQPTGLPPHVPLDTPARTGSTVESNANYRPSHMTVDLILSGKLDYMRMDPRSEFDLIRPLVWTIAHQEPKNNSQAATLKIAANALGGRLGQPHSASVTQHLISTILDWAKPLCFTSNGNYLCQQLLEKGTSEDKIDFIKTIENDIVPIANNKFGAHVLVKAIGVKKLESRISEALFKFGVYDSMTTGARKVWRPYLGKCRNSNETEIFTRIAEEMTGRWADLAVSNENGSISVQQIFEGCANQELMDACFKDLLEDISRIANNQFGHFVINKLLNFQEPMIKAVSNAILTAYPPLATNHHGVQFVEFVLNSSRVLQRNHIAKYLESLCSQDAGRTPAIVTVANSSVGRGHLQSVLRQVPPGERVLMSRVHNTCRQFQTTLRNSQSGNELLRSLGIINTPARRG